MAEVGVVLRVPQGVHSQLKDACAKHDRSMQKIILRLINDWLVDGSPNPDIPDETDPESVTNLSSKIKELETRLSKLEMYQGEPFW